AFADGELDLLGIFQRGRNRGHLLEPRTAVAGLQAERLELFHNPSGGALGTGGAGFASAHGVGGNALVVSAEPLRGDRGRKRLWGTRNVFRGCGLCGGGETQTGDGGEQDAATHGETPLMDEQSASVRPAARWRMRQRYFRTCMRDDDCHLHIRYHMHMHASKRARRMASA